MSIYTIFFLSDFCATQKIRKLYFIIFALAFLLSVSFFLYNETHAALPASGLVGYWRLDETSGTIAADSSGSGNSGTLEMGPVWTSGRVNGAVSFDGVDDHINVGDPASGVLDFGTGSFSYMAWVNLTAGGSTTQKIIMKGGTGPTTPGYELLFSSGAVRAAVSDGTARPVAPFTMELRDGTWHHVAAVVNRSSNFLILYVDGVQRAQTSIAGGGSVSTTQPLRFSLATSPLLGKIDEVLVYNRALTGSEITDVYNAGIADTTAPTLSSGAPTGTLPAGTTSTTMSVTTNEAATCRYSATAGTAYASMTNTFTTTGGTNHSTTLSGLSNGQTYTRYIRCIDTAGNANTSDYIITFSVAAPSDTTPPSTPTGLSATAVSSTEINLSWTASTDNVGVVGYRVFRGGVQIATVTGGTTYSDTGLSPSTTYSYTVSAYDAAGNTSVQSASASATTQAGSPPPPGPTIDPAGCTAMTDTQLRSMGYEPVRAHGAVGNGVADDTAEIRAAITAANDTRRAVYLHPGTYLVSGTLEFRQDIFETRNNTSYTRFGQTLLGSYCGSEKPTIRLADGTATQTNEQVIAAEPFPVISMWRPVSGATGPDQSDDGRDWDQVIRNVHIVLGNNPGAVGIRHKGAEGSATQEVTIDATGGFAGFYNMNGTGGYTYNVEVIGGRYGIYQEDGHGGSILVAGLTLSGQTDTPIALRGFTPFGVVGFHITHNNGRIISSIIGPETNHTVPGELRLELGPHDSSGHIYLVDGQIDVTGGTDETLRNTNRSVYLKNVYVRGQTNVLVNSTSGRLRAASPSAWARIGEFSYTGPYNSLYGEEGHLIGGARTEQTYYNGTLYATTADITVSDSSSPPGDLISRHLYPVALCNVEASNNVFATAHGANPNDTNDDTAAIQAAINAAASGSNRVFLPASSATPSFALTGQYQIRGTLLLGAQTKLCGATRYSSVLDARGWGSSSDLPVIETVDSPSASTVIADFQIRTPQGTGYVANGDNPQFNPHVYAILWRSGRNSINRDVFSRRDWNPGDIRLNVIRGNGGGRWYGLIQEGPYPPPEVPVGSGNRPYRDTSGNLIMSPHARQVLIEDTSGEPLTFYPYHLQHLTPPMGAMGEIRRASNVTMYGMKSEMASLPQTMLQIVDSNPPDLVPVLMFIRDSNNIALIGHEGTGQTDTGRALFEVTNSSNVTIASMGRRNGQAPAVPEDQWYFVEEDNVPTNALSAQGFLSLYKSAATASDTTAPTLSSGAPTGTLPAGTTSTTMSVTTNEAATCRYSATAGTAYASMTNTFTTTGGTNHSTTLSGLSNGQTYTRYIRCIDGAGNANTADYTIAFSVATPADTTAPTFSNIVASSITQSSATITWNTDEPADTQVEYGLTASYGQSTVLNTALVTSHSQTLSSLSAGTTYHYRVLSRDAANNLATSLDRTFTTSPAPDTQGPTAITNLAASSPDSTSATLTWSAPSDPPSGGAVASYDIRYSTSPITTSNWGSATMATGEPSPAAPGTSQSYILAGLNPSTAYYVALVPADAVGNLSTLSNVATFSTLPPPDTTAPLLSNIAVSSITSSSAVITWTTNEPADTRGEFGITISYGTTVTPDLALTTNHTINLSGLLASTTYHYRVESRDMAGIPAVSGDHIFTTLPPPDMTAPAAVTNLSGGNMTENSAVLSWTAPGDDGTVGTAASYEIRYSTSPITAANFSSATVVANPPTPLSAGSLQSITIGSLSPSTLYYAALVTRDEIGNTSQLSNVATFTTTAPVPPLDISPPVISNIAASGSANSVNITWNTNEPADSRVWWGTSESNLNNSDYSENLVTSHSRSLADLKRRKTYYYRVASRDAAGNSATSTIGSFRTGIGRTFPITNLTAAEGSVILSWAASDDEFAERTAIYRSTVGYPTSADTSLLLATVSGISQTTYKDTTAVNGTKYYYTLYAVDDLGIYSDPAHISFTTQASSTPTPSPTPTPTPTPAGGGGGGGSSSGGGGAPTAPAPVSPPAQVVGYGGPDQIVLAWKNPDGNNFVRVKIVRKAGIPPVHANDGETIYEGDQEEFTDTKNLKPGIRYHYGIFSLDRTLTPSSLALVSGILGEKTEAQIVREVHAAEMKKSGAPLFVFVFSRNLSFGTSGNDILELQKILQSLGFFSQGETPTGFFGPITLKAVRDFQKSKGIEQTGFVGPLTRAALGESYGAQPNANPPQIGAGITRALGMGMKGDDVTLLQQKLQSLGFFPKAETPTGFFGPITLKAVQDFQCSKLSICSGTPTTTGFGNVGPLTREIIVNAQSAIMKQRQTPGSSTEQITVNAQSAIANAKGLRGFVHGVTYAKDGDYSEALRLISDLKPRFWRLSNHSNNVYDFVVGEANFPTTQGTKITFIVQDAFTLSNGSVPPIRVDSGCGTNEPNCFKTFSDLKTDWQDFMNAFVKNLGLQKPTIDFFDIFSEPKREWQGVSSNELFQLFKIAHDTLRNFNPNIKIVAPSIASYNQEILESFLSDVAASGLRLDAVSWHEFETPEVVPDHVNSIQQFIKANPKLCNPACPEIHINEHTHYEQHLIPGWTVGWYRYLEKANIDLVGHACWDVKEGFRTWSTCWNGFNGMLLSDNKTPQPIYWVERAHAGLPDARLSVENTNPRITAIASKDDAKKELYILAGRYGTNSAGPVSIVINDYPYQSTGVLARIVRIPNTENKPQALASIPAATTLKITPNKNKTVLFEISNFADGEAYLITLTAQ